jgi:hypothetical protein
LSKNSASGKSEQDSGEGRRGKENSFTNCGPNLQEHGKAFCFTICVHTTQPLCAQKMNSQTIFEGDRKYNWSGDKIIRIKGIIEKG